MKQLNVRFQECTEDQIQSLVKEIGFDKSKIARAAMNYGLKEIQKNVDNGRKQKSVNIVGINMLRQTFNK